MTKEEAIEIIESARAVVLGNGEYDKAMGMAIEALKAEPKHGRWIVLHGVLGIYGDLGECSNCGLHLRKYEWNYCPNCGAKMDNAPTEKVDTPTENTNRPTDEVEE